MMRITDYDTIAYGNQNKDKKENNDLMNLLDSAVEHIEIKCNIADNLVKTENVKEITYIACEAIWFYLKSL